MQLVGLDPVTLERVRASLRGGPLHFTAAGAEPPDLCVAHARDAETVVGSGAPVIGFGPAGLLRAAFLAGCVDYLREPWLPEELELRALAVLERERKCFEFPWGTVAFQETGLRTPRGLVALTHHESTLLRVLLRARGEPVPRQALALTIWGNAARANGRALDVHVANVRRKLRRVEKDAGKFITSVRGKGYMVS